MAKNQNELLEGVDEDVDTRTKLPSQYKVIFHNDDYTPMDLVTRVLMLFFDKSSSEATHVMLSVHHEGHAVAGVYTYEIAETKMMEATRYARGQDAPLLITVEEA